MVTYVVVCMLVPPPHIVPHVLYYGTTHHTCCTMVPHALHNVVPSRRVVTCDNDRKQLKERMTFAPYMRMQFIK